MLIAQQLRICRVSLPARLRVGEISAYETVLVRARYSVIALEAANLTAILFLSGWRIND
jgi:hypothetical protein